jgi:hypothetical protein
MIVDIHKHVSLFFSSVETHRQKTRITREKKTKQKRKKSIDYVHS